MNIKKWWIAHIILGIVFVMLLEEGIIFDSNVFTLLFVGLVIGVVQGFASDIQQSGTRIRLAIASSIGFLAGWILFMVLAIPLGAITILLGSLEWTVALIFLIKPSIEWQVGGYQPFDTLLVYTAFGIGLGIITCSMAIFQLISLDKNPVRETSWLKFNLVGSVAAMTSLALVDGVSIPSDWSLSPYNLFGLLLGISVYALVTFQSARTELNDVYLRRKPLRPSESSQGAPSA